MTPLKTTIKDLSEEIRELKKYIKNPQNLDRSEQQSILHKKRQYARCMHIAYSLMRGRLYEQIEKPAENNPPNWDTIKEIQNEYTKNVHSCAV